MITRQLVKTPALAETPSADGAPDPYVADTYFTDGVHLYRLTGWLSRPGEQPLAELEDCRALHCTLVERKDLLAAGLTAVAVSP